MALSRPAREERGVREMAAINAKPRLIKGKEGAVPVDVELGLPVTAVVALGLRREDYHWLAPRLIALAGRPFRAAMSVHDELLHVDGGAWRPCSMYFELLDADALVLFALEAELAAAMRGRLVLVAMAPEARGEDEYRRMLDDAVSFALTGVPPSRSRRIPPEELFVYVKCLPFDVLTLHPSYELGYIR